jgi:hypothetical protein
VEIESDLGLKWFGFEARGSHMWIEEGWKDRESWQNSQYNR